jgi:hypothetical protein
MSEKIGGWFRTMILPVLLLGLGFFLIWRAKDDAGWIGVALIGLALFLRLIEGQKISSLGLGPDGIKVDLLQKLEEVQKEAEEARKKADTAERKADAAAETNSVSPTDAKQGSQTVSEEGALWSVPEKRVLKSAPSDDKQKFQWGGSAKRNGRELVGFVEESSGNPDLFWVRLIVRPTEGGVPIQSPVRFHLHQTFPKEVVQVRSRQGEAHLERYAYGAFTVGAEVMTEPDTFLELDLAADEAAPQRFRDR